MDKEPSNLWYDRYLLLWNKYIWILLHQHLRICSFLFFTDTQVRQFPNQWSEDTTVWKATSSAHGGRNRRKQAQNSRIDRRQDRFRKISFYSDLFFFFYRTIVYFEVKLVLNWNCEWLQNIQTSLAQIVPCWNLTNSKSLRPSDAYMRDKFTIIDSHNGLSPVQRQANNLTQC